ncbi:actinorhodin polyketide dimerase ActVB [Streptomyces lacrimifluminis]|uniref:Actinorhodin polyketide dimerase n=2 Tax=Streptomyces lacrimifluminis TaxID=1500077 RepID=A0A917KI16_9ACTN|nr:actinorhodin polyketide dimerase [Streptomyces lacrimifluminis]
MARFPAGVVVATTLDEHGLPRGFTASSFCSVSLTPPLVLVCLADSAESYGAFTRCARFAVSVLGPEHSALATRFATRSADKFADRGLTLTAARLPAVEGARSVLDCTVHERYPAGDHVIIVGRVTGARLGEGEPMVYFDRAFRSLA